MEAEIRMARGKCREELYRMYAWFTRRGLPPGCTLEPISWCGMVFHVNVRGHFRVRLECPVDMAITVGVVMCRLLLVSMENEPVYCDEAGFGRELPYAAEDDALILVQTVAFMDARGELVLTH